MNEKATRALRFAEEHLRKHGLDLEKLRGLVPDLQRGETLLLVGSVPEGLATDASDIDLLRVGHSKGRGLIIRFAEGTSSVWRLRGGVTINMDSWNLDDVEALGRRVLDGFRAMDGDLDENGQESDLQHYSPEESVFLHRCSTGVVLAGSALASHFRCDYRFAEIGLQFLMASFLDYASTIEKAWRQAIIGDNVSALWHATQAMDCMAFAMLASVGETNPYPTWRMRLLQRSSEALGKERVDQLLQLLFPSLQADAKQHIGAAKIFAQAEVGRIIARLPKNIAKWPSVPEIDLPREVSA